MFAVPVRSSSTSCTSSSCSSAPLLPELLVLLEQNIPMASPASEIPLPEKVNPLYPITTLTTARLPPTLSPQSSPNTSHLPHNGVILPGVPKSYPCFRANINNSPQVSVILKVLTTFSSTLSLPVSSGSPVEDGVNSQLCLVLEKNTELILVSHPKRMKDSDSPHVPHKMIITGQSPVPTIQDFLCEQ